MLDTEVSLLVVPATGVAAGFVRMRRVVECNGFGVGLVLEGRGGLTFVALFLVRAGPPTTKAPQ